MALMDRRTFEDHVRGFTIHDCAIKTKDRYCFLLVEDKEDRDTYPETRYLIVLADMPPESRFGWFHTGKMAFSTIARGTDPAEYVSVDSGSGCYSSDALRKGEETPIEDLIDMQTPVKTMVTIRKVVRAAGKLYAVGNNRRLYRREGVDNWVDLHSEGRGAPMPADYTARPDTDWGFELGFKDLSAFSGTDFYAAGGMGDLWRFDGTTWLQCPLPTEAPLETVCCAGDGKVYVTDLHGNVWSGRQDHWEQAATSEFGWGWQPRDAFWFKDRMYFGAQEGLYVIGPGKELVPLGEVDEAAPSSMVTGRIDISPDGKHMLTAGPYGACLYDGKRWTRLFSAYDFL